MQPQAPSSPSVLVEHGWRGRVHGVTRISAKAGFAAALVLAGVLGLIVYGISTAGHRHTQTTDVVNVTKSAQTPWWSAIPNVQSSVVRLPALSAPPRVRPVITEASHIQVPAIAPLSSEMKGFAAVAERASQRRTEIEAAQTAPVLVRFNDAAPSLANSVGSLPVPGAATTADGAQMTRSSATTRATATPAQILVLPRDATPLELLAGTIIPAVLLTGINADLQGSVIAQVRSDVYDSLAGRFLVVPRGSKLIGTYDNQVVQGQRRLLVAWTRLLYPSGASIDLDGMRAVDPAGYAGLGANVDEHLNKAFTSALLLSIIGAGAQLSQPQQGSLYAAPTVGQTIAGALGQQIGNTSIQLTQRQLQTPPTLQVPPGYLFNVLVDRDMVFGGPYAGGLP